MITCRHLMVPTFWRAERIAATVHTGQLTALSSLARWRVLPLSPRSRAAAHHCRRPVVHRTTFRTTGRRINVHAGRGYQRRGRPDSVREGPTVDSRHGRAGVVRSRGAGVPEQLGWSFHRKTCPARVSTPSVSQRRQRGVPRAAGTCRLVVVHRTAPRWRASVLRGGRGSGTAMTADARPVPAAGRRSSPGRRKARLAARAPVLRLRLAVVTGWVSGMRTTAIHVSAQAAEVVASYLRSPGT